MNAKVKRGLVLLAAGLFVVLAVQSEAAATNEYDFLTVNCHDMSNDELATLKVGRTATVVGTFEDGGDLGVEVRDCKLA